MLWIIKCLFNRPYSNDWLTDLYLLTYFLIASDKHNSRTIWSFFTNQCCSWSPCRHTFSPITAATMPWCYLWLHCFLNYTTEVIIRNVLGTYNGFSVRFEWLNWFMIDCRSISQNIGMLCKEFYIVTLFRFLRVCIFCLFFTSMLDDNTSTQCIIFFFN